MTKFLLPFKNSTLSRSLIFPLRDSGWQNVIECLGPYDDLKWVLTSVVGVRWVRFWPIFIGIHGHNLVRLGSLRDDFQYKRVAGSWREHFTVMNCAASDGHEKT